jgi:DNA-binding CsgD family transcriptional regulator
MIRITPTERTILRLTADGLTNKEIAKELYISYRTVETHLTNLQVKLSLRNKIQLAVYYVRSLYE